MQGPQKGKCLSIVLSARDIREDSCGTEKRIFSALLRNICYLLNLSLTSLLKNLIIQLLWKPFATTQTCSKSTVLLRLIGSRSYSKNTLTARLCFQYAGPYVKGSGRSQIPNMRSTPLRGTILTENPNLPNTPISSPRRLTPKYRKDDTRKILDQICFPECIPLPFMQCPNLEQTPFNLSTISQPENSLPTQ
jgi:hypothetical protein